MIEYLNEIYQVLNSFYKSTGIGTMFFDTELDLIACRPSKIIADDFICLGTNQITPFLTEKFALKPERKRTFYTYFLEGNLVCTIVMMAKNESYIGAFITQPIFLKTHSQDETNALLEQICPILNEKETFMHVLLRVPVRAYESLEPLGETLNSLSQTVFGDNAVSQVMCGATSDVTEVKVESFAIIQEFDIEEDLPLRQLRLSTYFKLKECIQNGNSAALDDIFGKISNNDLPTHQLDRSNYLRSLKNSYIKICSMACYAAIDANAPYYKLLDLTDELIRKVEKLENVADIFNLMRKTLSDFARAVEISRIQKYSKPIRQVLDYINAHFDEKITLEMLAEQTKLSTFYLSTLIKKETGLMLMDNINAVRVEESKNLLLKNNTNVLDVAQQVGFLYQNHFSTVFKKFTGFTPTEFVKAMGTEIEKKGKTKKMSQPLQIIADRLRKALLMLPELSAAARIVDPINHFSWLIGNAEEDTSKETCYYFWSKNKSCDNCISYMAYLQNRSFVKIDRNNDESVFLVIAAPITVGANTCIVEIIINVTNEVFVDIDFDAKNRALAKTTLNSAFDGKELFTFCERTQIDTDLPFYVRYSKLENRPLSVIVIFINDLPTEIDFSEPVVKESLNSQYAQVIAASVKSTQCLAGHYTGSVLMVTLNDTDFENACAIGDEIKLNLEKQVFVIEEKAFMITVDYGVKLLTDKILNANEFVRLAIIDLNKKLTEKHALAGE